MAVKMVVRPIANYAKCLLTSRSYIAMATLIPRRRLAACAGNRAVDLQDHYGQRYRTGSRGSPPRAAATPQLVTASAPGLVSPARSVSSSARRHGLHPLFRRASVPWAAAFLTQG